MTNLIPRAERAIAERLVDRLLYKLDVEEKMDADKRQQQRTKTYLEILELSRHFMGEALTDEKYLSLRDYMKDSDHRWMRLIGDILDNTDPGYAKKAILSLGFEAFFRGTKEIRANREIYGCNIPWLILFDPTMACNMHCIGCWSGTYDHKDSLTYEQMDRIVSEGKELGTHLYMLTGGEPLVRKKDILKLVTTLIANTKGDGKSGDEFWTKAETLLYCALIGYIHYEAPVEEQNFATLIEFINAMEVREDDEEFQNPVDIMFENLEKKNPKHFAVRQYKKYKLAAGKTAKSILISCGARLAVFDIQELREITAYDELELDTIGDRKTALFLIMSDTDATFNFLISMIYTQLFNLLCEKADDVYGGRLPVHVRCLIDEAANIGQIPNLEKLVATIRSREISACLVLQARSQLKAIYKDNADTIIGNMDSQIFLGGSEPTTLKELAEALGKETIDTINTSDTRGNSPSYGTNYQKLGKELMSRDELAVMNGSKCVLQLRGVRPFLSDKYDITQHPNYKYTSDYDKKYTFDIGKYLNRRMRLKADDEYDVVEA